MIKVIAAALVLVVAPLATLDACPKDQSPGVRTNRPPEERQVDPGRKRTVTIRANARQVPYTVYVKVSDRRGGFDESGPTPVMEPVGDYVQTVIYTSGERLGIFVEVKPPVVNAWAYCEIRDGPDNISKMGPMSEGWRAMCELTTKR